MDTLFSRRTIQRRAFALLVVLWCIGIMTLTVMGFIGFVSLQLDENTSRAKDFRAEQLAESGLALGLSQQVQELDPVLHKQFSSIESFDVTLTSEGSRLNLNAMLQNGQTALLSRLWVQWGLTQDEATGLNDCLLDWIDADDNRRLHGAERPEYTALGFPQYPANQPFETLEEVTHVIGFDKVMQLRPDWRNFFTLWSNGQLDLNEAPAELIAAVLNVGLETAQQFVQARAKLIPPNSLAPYQFPNTDQPRAMMGLTTNEFNLVSNLVTVKSTYTRIESCGIVDRHKHTLVVVTNRNANTPVYYLWQEY